MAKKAMFCLEPQIKFHDLRHDQWGMLLGTDAAFLNAIIFVGHFYFELARGKKPEEEGQPTMTAYKHLAKTLRLLQQKLNEDTTRVADSTLMVILTLASHSIRLGHHDTASGHMQGTRKIVDLRGGVAGFKGNSKLLIEIFR